MDQEKKLESLKLELNDLDEKIKELSKDFKLNTCDKINIYIFNKYFEWRCYVKTILKNC
jgi:hypothetical protein